MIEDRAQELDPQTLVDLSIESLKQKVPTFLYEYLDVFSKEQSDTLPPHCSIDHKIELTEDNNLGFSHLNKHSLEELMAIQEYLIDNLLKGFIVSSKVPFTSLVLFVHKSDRSLRFCIDYCKLNTLTKKNRYPLPLIDETLA